MKKIILAHNKFALVDDGDFEWLNQWKWSVNSQTFVSRYQGKKFVTMHRLIMDFPKGLEIDHINGDRLDNRRSNLRVCTGSQNCMNREPTTKGISGYRGVTWYSNKWQARIEIKDKKISLGFFDDKKDAALAYNKAAIKYFGNFARLNII